MSDLAEEWLVLEGIVTTVNPDGTPHLSAMGPLVNAALDRFVLRPFRTSTTWGNLLRTGRCVAHVTDDVELVARAALHLTETPPELARTASGNGYLLASACRWYELKVDPTAVEQDSERPSLRCEVIDAGRLRDFFGLNRAKHAVVESAILATRLSFMPRDEVLDEVRRLRPLVEKTGGAAERRAFSLVENYVLAWEPA